MKLRLLKIGKPANRAYLDLVASYDKRLKGRFKVDSHIMKAHEGVEKSVKELCTYLKIDWQTKLADPSHVIIALDERGFCFSSPELASYVDSLSMDGFVKSVTFVIGGPYGLPDEVRSAAHKVWSLSKAVFPSDMAWVIAWEQLYRVSSILGGGSYHHE